MKLNIDPDASQIALSIIRFVLIVMESGFHDPKEFGRAMAAWMYGLSRDDVKLLEYVSRGLTNSEIADHMRLAEENSVKNRMKSLFNKLGVDNRVQAAAIANIYGFGEKPNIRQHSKE